jgi:formylglycine-generating enzyme required for sulfatase activity
MADIFVSYKKEDRSKAERVVAVLRADGYSVWWDDNLTPRNSWDAEIEHQISAAKVVFVLWSAKAAALTRQPNGEMTGSFVRKEAQYALERGKYVASWIERCELPLAFADRQTADLSSWNFAAVDHSEWRKVLSWIEPLARTPPSGTSQPREARPNRDARLRPGLVWRDAIPGLWESASPEMVTIPPGEFLMGASAGEEGSIGDERPQHEVRIDYAFALGKYAVTFAEWDAAIAAGAKLEKPSDQGWGRDRRPVIDVNWNDARAYIAWLNGKLGLEGRADAYRLPSEAEREYACRAGTTTPFSFGATISTAQANYNGEYTYGAGKKGEKRGKTTPVGSFHANPCGLHDMHGNVNEWCEDVWNASYNGAPTDGSPWLTGDESSRVLRGGSWIDGPQYLRAADRNRSIPTLRNWGVGFRVARTL